MVCYGCGVELFGYQAYQSLYCSQCLNRRSIEKQTALQAKIAERQLELQQEQMREMEEQRELMEQRQQELLYSQPRTTRSDTSRSEPLPDLEDLFRSEPRTQENRKILSEMVRDRIIEEKRKNPRPYMELLEDIKNGEMPHPYELAAAYEVLYNQAADVAVETGKAMVTVFQKHLGVNFNTARALLEDMSDRNFIGKFDEALGMCPINDH